MGRERDGGPAQADAVPVHRLQDLRPTVAVDSTYNQELHEGPDGKHHLPGDPVGTQRYSDGALAGMDGKYVTDTNPQARADIESRAVKDPATTHDQVPQPGAGKEDDALLDRVKARQEIETKRDEAWDTHLKPIASKLDDAGIHLDKGHCKGNSDDLQQSAWNHLEPQERAHLAVGLKKVAQYNTELKDASEQLGIAGGNLLQAREFKDATIFTGGTDERRSPGNLDRVVMIDEDKRSVIVMEEKGVNGGLGSRLVEDPADPTGPHIRAEQGSTEYLRHMLEHDNRLAAQMRSDPELSQRVESLVHGPDPSDLRYLLVRTGRDGIVTSTDFKIDEDRLNRPAIRLAGTWQGGQALSEKCIGAAETEKILTLLGSLRPPLDRDQIQIILDRQEWTVEAELEGEAVIAAGSWPSGGGGVTITFDGGHAKDIGIGICASKEDSTATRQEAFQAYVDTVERATSHWGEPAGVIGGQQPRVWFDLSGATVSISNMKSTTTVAWWSPDHARWALSTFTPEQS